MHEQKFSTQINTLIPTSTHKIPILQIYTQNINSRYNTHALLF